MYSSTFSTGIGAKILSGPSSITVSYIGILGRVGPLKLWEPLIVAEEVWYFFSPVGIQEIFDFIKA